MASVVDAVYGVTADPRERAALLFACGAESGCMSIQNRAGAPAYGPWQIYLPYNAGVTAQEANDPSFAASYMYTHHNVSGCVQQQAGLWSSNPMQAAQNAARCIEGATDAEPYSQAQISMGWQMAQPALNGTKANTGPFANVPILGGIVNAGQQAGSAITAPARLAGAILTTISDPHWWIRILLVGGGMILVLMGIGSLMHLGEKAEAVAPIAAAAA